MSNLETEPINEKEIRDVLNKYPSLRSGLLPLLHLVQKKYGYVPKETAEIIARILSLSPTEVESVLSFYTMYRSIPAGKNVIQVCTNISCSLEGSEDILGYLKERLKVKGGETTSDGKFTLKTVECLGACGGAPVVQINDTYYENMTSAKLEEIVSKLEKEPQIKSA